MFLLTVKSQYNNINQEEMDYYYYYYFWRIRRKGFWLQYF